MDGGFLLISKSAQVLKARGGRKFTGSGAAAPSPFVYLEYKDMPVESERSGLLSNIIPEYMEMEGNSSDKVAIHWIQFLAIIGSRRPRSPSNTTGETLQENSRTTRGATRLPVDDIQPSHDPR